MMTKEDVKMNWLAVAESGSMTAIHNLREHYADIEKQLENERKLNEEIKVRFVKCNSCTPDMKDKCLMFNENLCEGERCEELVDLMALVDKRDSDDKFDKATKLLNEFMRIGKASDEDFEHDYSELIRETEQFIQENK